MKSESIPRQHCVRSGRLPRWILTALLICLSLPGQPRESLADDGVISTAFAEIARWDLPVFSTYKLPDNHSALVQVSLPAINLRKGWKVTYQGQPVAVGPEGRFTIRHWVTRPGPTSILVSAESPTGETASQAVSVDVPGSLWRIETAFNLKTRTPASVQTEAPRVGSESDQETSAVSPAVPSSPWTLTPGLDVSLLDYQQTERSRYRSTSLTARIAAGYNPPGSRWNASASLFATAFPITRNLPVTIQFVGLNARVGVKLLPPESRFQLVLSPGYYYTTCLVTAASDSEAMGFANLSGPQLFMQGLFGFGNGHSVSAYVKGALVTDLFTLLSTTNREIAVGLSYGKRLKSGRIWSVGLNIADLAFATDVQSLSSTSTSLGFSLSF